MLFELINPSDRYTFVAPSIEIAGACAVFLSPYYGAKCIDGSIDETTPIMFGWNEWLKDRGIDKDWIESHLLEIADCFDSFLIGDRADAEKAMSLMSPEEAKVFRNERQERLRSSMSKIGELAYEYADVYRNAAKEKGTVKNG